MDPAEAVSDLFDTGDEGDAAAQYGARRRAARRTSLEDAQLLAPYATHALVVNESATGLRLVTEVILDPGTLVRLVVARRAVDEHDEEPGRVDGSAGDDALAQSRALDGALADARGERRLTARVVWGRVRIDGYVCGLERVEGTEVEDVLASPAAERVHLAPETTDIVANPSNTALASNAEGETSSRRA